MNHIWIIEQKYSEKWMAQAFPTKSAYGTKAIADYSLRQLRREWPDIKYRVKKYVSVE